MAVYASTDCKIFIGTNVTALASETAWEEIGEVENLGEFGDSFTAIDFLSLNDGRVRKAKGSANAGDINLVIGYDYADAGHSDLRAAGDDTSSNPYNFMVQLNDAPPWEAPDIGSTPTTLKFRALVQGLRLNVGAANQIVTANTTLSITTAITWVEAAVTPAP